MGTDKYYILIDAEPSEHAEDLLPRFGDERPQDGETRGNHTHVVEPPAVRNAKTKYSPEDVAAKTKLPGGVAILVGGVVTLVGIPMLILPGPGLLAIGGGLTLMTKGAKSLFDKRKG